LPTFCTDTIFRESLKSSNAILLRYVARRYASQHLRTSPGPPPTTRWYLLNQCEPLLRQSIPQSPCLAHLLRPRCPKEYCPTPLRPRLLTLQTRYHRCQVDSIGNSLVFSTSRLPIPLLPLGTERSGVAGSPTPWGLYSHVEWIPFPQRSNISSIDILDASRWPYELYLYFIHTTHLGLHCCILLLNGPLCARAIFLLSLHSLHVTIPITINQTESA